MPPITTTIVHTGTGPSLPPIIIGSHKIDCPKRSIITQEVSNAKPLDASINQFTVEHRNPKPGWSRITGRKSVINKSSDVYARSPMNFGSDIILSENPNFMNFGRLCVNTTDELGSVLVSTSKVRRPTNGSNWIPPGHDISEATADRVSETFF